MPLVIPPPMAAHLASRVALSLVLLLLAVPVALSLGGCGYRFAGRVLAEQPIALEVHSAALEPALALTARRGLESAAVQHGLALRRTASAGEVEGWSLRVTVHSATARPVGAVHRGGDGGGAVAATSYEATAVLVAELVGADGARHERVATGTALFEDTLLPLWTDDARQRATEQAIALACDELGDWLAVTLAATR